MLVTYIYAQSIEFMNAKQNIKVINFVSVERFSIECRTTKTKTSYLLIRLFSQLQPLVKPKPNQSNCSTTSTTALKTALYSTTSSNKSAYYYARRGILEAETFAYTKNL